MYIQGFIFSIRTSWSFAVSNTSTLVSFSSEEQLTSLTG